MIANTRFYIMGQGTYGVILVRIGKQVFWSGHDADLSSWVGEDGDGKNSVFAQPDFLEILQLRMNDDDDRDWLSVNVSFHLEPMSINETNLMRDDPIHRALHKPAEDRAEAMLSKLRRY